MDCISVTEAFKFNGDGFYTWQKKPMYKLKRKSLWGMDDPLEDNLSSSSTQDKHKALGIIAKDLHNEVIHHISDVKGAKEACDQLNKFFGSETQHSKIYLLMQFYYFDKEKSDTMAHHINKFKALKQQLIGVKKVIPEDEVITTLFNVAIVW